MTEPTFKDGDRLPALRVAAGACAAALFLAWAAAHFQRLVSSQDGLIRFTLTAFFSVLIALRPKGPRPAGAPLYSGAVSALLPAGLGLIAGLSGLVFGVRQFEWAGLLLLVFGCLRWSFPARYGRDLLLAVALLYWAHPMPARFFDWLQGAMQVLSVRGSEWLLHMLNVRVWADGMVLRTGMNTYEIPAWCSGMRTATTVFLLAIGLSTLKRLRPVETAAVTAAALVQALALNVVRISALVLVGPMSGGAGGDEFLHNTGGIIVLAAILLVWIEINAACSRAAVRRAGAHAGGPDDRAGPATPPVWMARYPPFWKALIEHKLFLALLGAGLLLAAALAYKSRPYHRLEMIKGVAEQLRDTGDLASAERAAELVARRRPDDLDWALERAKILLMRGKNEQVAAELGSRRFAGGPRRVERDIVMAYALMALDRMDEAAGLVAGIPDRLRRNDPRLAMIIAELGFRAGDPGKVAEYLPAAAFWRFNLPRIRNLHPYLRAHRKWDAIVRSDVKAPFSHVVHALVAAEANMNLNNSSVVARLANEMAAKWPDDPRVLVPLFFLALKDGPGEWEDRFAAQFSRCARRMTSTDEIYELAGKCVELGRSDLLWLACRRMGELDPACPCLFMCAARHGDRWFSFRNRYLGFPALAENETTDLRPLYRLALCLRPWNRLAGLIPMGDELCDQDTLAARKRFLDRALTEFRTRAQAAPPRLSIPMRYEYVHALDISGDIESARRVLEQIVESDPSERESALVVLSELYEKRGDWQNVYETLRGYPDLSGRAFAAAGTAQFFDPDLPDLVPLLRLCRSFMNLGFGLGAVETARDAVLHFPGSAQAAEMAATVLAKHDSPEEALFALNAPRPWRRRGTDVLEARLLHETQRFEEESVFCRSALLPRKPLDGNSTQKLMLPPAELAALWHRVSVPTDADFAAHAETLRGNLPATTSPFLRNLAGLWLKRREQNRNLKSQISNLKSEIAAWTGIGRDPIERAVAANQLTLFLCREQRLADARAAAEAAVRFLPDSAMLWRILISLSGSDPGALDNARRSCPDDPEIWLAWLVAGTQRGAAGIERPSGENPDTARVLTEKDVLAHLSAVCGGATPRYSPGAVTRAGEYLFRVGMNKAASVAARDAARRARGLLPAFLLGVKCGIAEQDKAWTLACAKAAIEASLRPMPVLYRKVVEIKASDPPIASDNDTVQALEMLCRADPANTCWPQVLGMVRFERGGWELMDSMYRMTAAIEGGATNRLPYAMGAEAARLLGNDNKAVELLREGLKTHPNDVWLLNNLAYTLADTRDGLAEALSIAPTLLGRAGDSAATLDTAAVVYLKARSFPEAREVISRLLQVAESGTRLGFRAGMHHAELVMREGEAGGKSAESREKAAGLLRDILRETRGIPVEDLMSASKLLEECEEKETAAP